MRPPNTTLILSNNPYFRKLTWIVQDRDPCLQFSGLNLDLNGP